MNNTTTKILIAEDDVLMSKILEFMLRKAGYELIIYKDGLTALENIATELPDLIITDIMLPLRSGLEIISFTKMNYPNIPVIVVSALGEEEGTVIEAFKLGADDLVSKPFNPNELLLRTNRLLAKNKQIDIENIPA